MIDIEEGDKVFKLKGYKFPGIVVSKFKTLKGKTRYVVECTAPDCEEMLHIYSMKDIARSCDD